MNFPRSLDLECIQKKVLLSHQADNLFRKMSDAFPLNQLMLARVPPCEVFKSLFSNLFNMTLRGFDNEPLPLRRQSLGLLSIQDFQMFCTYKYSEEYHPVPTKSRKPIANAGLYFFRQKLIDVSKLLS